MRTDRAATIADVAREAGVSPYTVSAVLNGARSNTRVSPATRQRIATTAARMHYQPNAQARGLARRRSGAVGVLFGVVDSTAALANSYASALLDGIVSRAAGRGCDVMLYTEPWKCASLSAARFRDRRTDGVIVVAPLTDSDMLAGLSMPGAVPVVAISPDPAQAAMHETAWVDVDNAHGIVLAVEHLVSLGHTRIAHLTGNANVSSVSVRHAAFDDALRAAGLPPAPPEYVIECTYDASTVPAAVDVLLSLASPPTAIVAGNDNIALSVLQTARGRGVAVPESLSVVGFDDIPAAEQVTPALTTIRQPLRAIGAAAFDLLFARIDAALSEDECSLPPETRLLAPDLIVRGSTAKPMPVCLPSPKK